MSRIAKVSLSSTDGLYASLHSTLICWGRVFECGDCGAVGHEYKINPSQCCPSCGDDSGWIIERVGRYERRQSGYWNLILFKLKKFKWVWVLRE